MRMFCALVLVCSAGSLFSGDDAPAEPDLQRGLIGLTFKPGPSESDPAYKAIEDALRGSFKRAVMTPLIATVKTAQVELSGPALQKDADEKKIGWVFDLAGTFAIVKKGKDKAGASQFVVSCSLEMSAFWRDKSGWKPVLNKVRAVPVLADNPGPVPMTNPLAEPLHEALVPVKIANIGRKDQPRGGGNTSAMHIYTISFTVTNRLPIEINKIYPLLYSTPKKPLPGAPPGVPLKMQPVGITRVTPLTLKPGESGTFEGIVEGYIVDETVVWPPQRVVASTTLQF